MPFSEGETLLLVPASVGALWFVRHIHRWADVFFLHPRLTFVGHSSPYPKDLMLCRFDRRRKGQYYAWNWKTGVVL